MEKQVKIETKVLLSLLWVVLSVNYIFCDVFTLMHVEDLKNILEGKAGDMNITQEFLLGFAFIMEIPMIMILLSRILKYKTNRILNMVFAVVLFIVQAGSLTVGDTTLHYIFFSIIELGLCIALFVVALKWKE